MAAPATTAARRLLSPLSEAVQDNVLETDWNACHELIWT